jgi:hypothetical protein
MIAYPPPVTITIDLDGLLPTAAVFPVDAVGDYVPACLAIRATLRQPGVAGSLEVRVRDGVAAVWLSAAAAAYGDEWIGVRHYTARQALRERWQLDVPAIVTDRDILQAGLLDQVVTPRTGQSFDDVVLEQFYGDIFAYPCFPIAHLPALLAAFDPDRWRENERRVVVTRVYRARLASWVRRETDESRRALIDRLRTAPDQLRRDLVAYAVLRGYPAQLGERVLGVTWAMFIGARVDTESCVVTEHDLAAATTTELAYYLTEQRSRVTSPADLEVLLDLMSGRLLVEFDTIDTLAHQHTEWLTPVLLRRIERQFAPLHRRIAPQLAELRLLIAPPFPAQPEKRWGAVEWLAWVRDAYMPYYRWLEAQRRRDEQLAGYATMFADWYYEHFLALKLGTPEHFAFAALYGDRARFVNGDAVALVILLDNFNYTHFEELRRLCNQQGFSLVAEQPLFSLIPTATEVGKGAIIAGSGEPAELPRNGYPDLIAKAWAPILTRAGKSAAYLANIGELQRLRECQHDLYFLNYLAVDDALHRDAAQTGQEHGPVVRGLLDQLVHTIHEFATRTQIEQRLLVYIVSDHGSTRIARDVINVLDTKFFGSMALDRHHRYIAISPAQRAVLPQVATAQCYVVDRERHGTRQDYLAAKEYYRFVETDDGVYVHGGLTPEEVVVPFARFALMPIDPLPPTLRLLGDQFRYAIRSTVELEVGNPNPYQLDDVRVRLIGLVSEEAVIETIGPQQRSTVSLTTVFRKEPGTGNSRELLARVRYECQGRLCDTVDTSFAITMKALMEVTDDLDL